jgi:hypothetical protein
VEEGEGGARSRGQETTVQAVERLHIDPFVQKALCALVNGLLFLLLSAMWLVAFGPETFSTCCLTITYDT